MRHSPRISASKQSTNALEVLLEDVEELLQLRIAREKWLVSDQLSCHLQPN
jgi:hypothetical protein